MKKLHSLMACALVACVTLVLFSSCEGIGGFAPRSVVGKTFRDRLGHQFTMETDSKYSYLAGSDDDKKYSPTYYTYEKTGDNTATLVIFKDKNPSYSGSIKEYRRDLYLNFTSKEAGWYIDNSLGMIDFTLE